MVERNLEPLLGIRFVATEFATGDRQRGRIDTLGLDQDGTPTIVEYKKTSKENVINQGLFYLDWLIEHKGDFALAVQATLGDSNAINWSNPRLILIAENFSEYDKYAVNRIGANIELWVYRLYGRNLLYLDPIFASTTPRPPASSIDESVDETEEAVLYTLEDHLKGKPEETTALFQQLREQILGLGDEIVEKAVKLYIGYKHGRNFCEVKVQQKNLKLYLDIPFEELHDPNGLAKDVSKIGHHGTGDVEANLEGSDEIPAVIMLIEQAYQLTL